MRAIQPTKSEVAAKFAAGTHCAQCSLCPWADALGYDEEELARMSCAFGGGMFRGDTCGAVSGALMAIGLACGGDGPAGVEAVKEKTAQFQAAFAQRFGSTLCRDLLGYDLAKPGEHEKAAESGRLLEYCPELVCGAIEILNELLQDE